MIEIKSVDISYGDLQIVKNVSISVGEGKTVSILGPNGAGKSTLLNAVAGFVPVSKGDILFNSRSICYIAPFDLVKLGIAMVPEGRRIFNSLRVRENLELGAYSYFRNKNKENIKDRIKQVYRLFPLLERRAKQIAGSLSGGEQQMLAIGRALMAKPKVLLLDEPAMGLAPLVAKEIFSKISHLCSEGTTILLVEQNARAALKISDHVYVLSSGTVVAEGKPDDLLQDERIRRAYLG